MERTARPRIATVFTVLLALSALATGWVGLTIKGFLVPAASLLVLAVLMWKGKAWRLFFWLVIINLISGIATDLVLAVGDGLGHRKLDISGVALLINLATGGPLMGFLALPILIAQWWKPTLREWFREHVPHRLLGART